MTASKYFALLFFFFKTFAKYGFLQNRCRDGDKLQNNNSSPLIGIGVAEAKQRQFEHHDGVFQVNGLITSLCKHAAGSW